MPDTLKVEAGENGAIGLEATAVASSITVFEGALMHAVVWEDHAAHTVWLSEFVDGAYVDVLLCLNSLNLELIRKEAIENVFLNRINAITCDSLAQIEHILGVVDLVFDGGEEAGQRGHFQGVAVLVDELS